MEKITVEKKEDTFT